MWLRSSRRHVHESIDNNEDGEGQLVREIADSREGPFEALERKQVRLAILKALRLLSASHRELRRGRAQLRRALENLRTTQASRDNRLTRRAGMQYALPEATIVDSWERTSEGVTGCAG
jgi:hypothetical protein